MQLYNGLPIATNKISQDERKGIPHHLLGCIGLEEETWTVGKFVEEARTTIAEIRSRGKLPILVGGTHYYTQSLLFTESVLNPNDRWLPVAEQEKKWPILAASGAEMYGELQKVDPVMAARWHPKDVRKIRRSLEIWLQTGKRASETYAEQRNGKCRPERESEVSKLDSAPIQTLESPAVGLKPASLLRYDTLLLWVYSDLDVLRERLNKRVDGMINGGLLQEIESMEAFRRKQSETGAAVDTTRGIWVAIGYKEFGEYFEALRGGSDRVRLQQLKEQCTEQMKAATRQYAKSQIRWIRLRLLQEIRGANSADKMFLLDGSDLKTWSEAVEDVAEVLTEGFLSGRPLPSPLGISKVSAAILSSDEPDRETVVRTQSCELCQVTVTTEKDWEQHLKSKQHKSLLKSQRNPDRQKRISTSEKLSPSAVADRRREQRNEQQHMDFDPEEASRLLFS